MEQVRYRADGSVWQELLLKHRAQEKKWDRLSLVFGLTKLALLITIFLTVYFIWLRQSPAVGAATDPSILE